MAWLSRVNFTASDVLSYTDLNNLGNDIRAWGGNVNGGGYTLSNVILSASSGTMATVIGGTGTTSTLTLRSTSGVGTIGADIIFQTGNNGATEVMRLQNGGNVGIGTSSPGQKLVVVGNIVAGNTGTTADGYIDIDGGSTGKVRISRTGTGATASGMVFYTQFSTLQERMRILSTGEVGIGTSSPAVKLDVAGSIKGVSAGGPTAVVPLLYQSYSGITSATSANVETLIVYGYKDTGTSNSQAVFQVARKPFTVTPAAAWDASADTLLTVAQSGNVGIGTSSPSYRLDVRGGDISVSRGTSSAADASIYFGSNSNNYIYSGNSSNIFAIATNGSERMRIDSAGKVGINKIPLIATLDVNGQSSMTALWVTGAGNAGLVIDYVGASANYYDASHHTFRGVSGGATMVGIGAFPSYQLQLSTDSAAKPTTNTWTIASDSRLKTVKGEYQKGLAEICQVRPVSYEYNGKAGFIADGKDKVSILAQELIQVFPECVDTFKGKLEEDGPEIDLYNYNGHAITFALINAIKELKAEIDILKARN